MWMSKAVQILMSGAAPDGVVHTWKYTYSFAEMVRQKEVLDHTYTSALTLS